MNRDPFSKFHTKTKNEKRKTKNEKRKTKKEVKIRLIKSYKREKRGAQSEFEFRFLPGGEKMENENESPIWFFCCKEKRITKIKFVSFSYTTENRLALRYMD